MNKEDAKDQIREYYKDDAELMQAINDGTIHDTIHEIADGNVDVYTINLIKWVGKAENYGYIEDAIDEYGFPESDGKPDFIRAIMQGQYKQNEEALNLALEELEDELPFEK